SEEHTSELQSRFDLVCRRLLEKKNRSLSTGVPLRYFRRQKAGCLARLTGWRRENGGCAAQPARRGAILAGSTQASTRPWHDVPPAPLQAAVIATGARTPGRLPPRRRRSDE